MSASSTYENPLIRDGRSQSDRNLPALSPDYVKIDERNREDLIAFARDYSKLIQYYNDNNERSGDWSDFFREGTSADQPHYALFLAFNWLFRLLQKDLNSLTGRHLDHYYKEILKLRHKPAQADSVHLLMELAKNVDQHLLKKGTLLKAGKDALGKELFYAIDKDIVLNKTKVSALKTIFTEQAYDTDGELSKHNSYGLYAAPIANSSDGEGADMETDGLSWKLLGESQSTDTSTMPKADMGFAIASPVLLLKEGIRKLTLSIFSQNSLFDDFIPYLLSQSLQTTAFDKEEIELLQDLFSNVNFPESISENQTTSLTKLCKILGVHLNNVLQEEERQMKAAEDNKEDYDKTRYHKIRDWSTLPGAKAESEEEGENSSGPTNEQKFDALKEAFEFYYEEALKQSFIISFSGEKGWVGPYTIDAKCPQSRSLVIEIDLAIDDPAIVAYNEELLLAGFDTKAPVMKVLLSKTNSNRYSFLKKIRPLELELAVAVKGVRNLVLQNDTANLNPNKPFLPFGPQPTLDSHFYIGSEEIFQKTLNAISMHFEWADLPDDLIEHYKVYSLDTDKTLETRIAAIKAKIKKVETALNTDGAVERTQAITGLSSSFPEIKDEETAKKKLDSLNAELDKQMESLPINLDAFRGKISLLQNGDWQRFSRDEEGKGLKLFSRTDGKKNTLSVTFDEDKYRFSRPAEIKPVTQLDNSSLYGFARLALTGPALGKFKAFGHQRYSQLYTEKIIEKLSPDNEETVDLPNEPYTPTVSSLSIDYNSKVKVNFNTGKDDHEQFFHVHPFGLSQPQLSSNGDKSGATIIPIYNDEGCLLIGLEKLDAPQNLSLLLQLNEKSVDHEFVGKVAVTWSYLKNDTWVDFEPEEILEDSTEVFTQSGIITFQMPKGITDKNSLMPSGKFWIKASVANNTLGVADALNISAQAITASFVDFDNDPAHLATALTAKSIKKLKVSDSAIKSITQSYPSFGGQLAEQNESFYTRVSERLRHKRRAISIWDYEHLVLEAFPDVYKVKCLNHYDPEQSECRKEMSPGAVTLIILSKGEEETEISRKLAPVTNVITLNAIKKYLEDISPAFVSARNKLFIKNPSYTRVKIDCHVKFTEGVDVNFYKTQLEADLMQFLSPWAFDTSRPISLERKLYKSLIINFIEERDYVNFVCCFKVITFDADDNDKELEGEIIAAAGPADVLISYDKHTITEITGDECDCTDKPPVQTPKEVTHGIGAMIIETDFIVAKNE